MGDHFVKVMPFEAWNRMLSEDESTLCKTKNVMGEKMCHHKTTQIHKHEMKKY